MTGAVTPTGSSASRRPASASSRRSPARPTPEQAFLSEARGRILAEDVMSLTALPPWDNSAMDGYAIRAADVAGATETAPVRLEVIGEVRAGVAPDAAVERGTAIRIATGAPIPPRADAVVQVELTTPADADGAPTGERGRDATGPLPAAVLVHAADRARDGDPEGRRRPRTRRRDPRGPGRRLSPAAVALAAGSGNETLRVHRRPVVGDPRDGRRGPGRGTRPRPGRDPRRERPGALGARRGGRWPRPHNLGIAADRLEDVRARLVAALRGRRRRDRSCRAASRSGRTTSSARPSRRSAGSSSGGSPSSRASRSPSGSSSDADGGSRTLLFGLPGNPVSSFVTFELFVRPGASGGWPACRRDASLRTTDRAVLRDDVTKSPGRRAFLRVVTERDAEGRTVRDADGRVPVRLAGGGRGQGSHVLSALAHRRRPRDRPGDGRRAPGRIARRPVVARPRLIVGRRRPSGTPILGAMARDIPPRSERRRLTHVDRSGRPRMVDVTRQAVHRAPSRRRGHGRGPATRR